MGKKNYNALRTFFEEDLTALGLDYLSELYLTETTTLSSVLPGF